MIHKARKPKNKAEAKAFEELLQMGWIASEKGWPQRKPQTILCYKDSGVMAIEVKPSERVHLRPEQLATMHKLSQAGIKCFIWTPREKFKPFYDYLDSMELQGLDRKRIAMIQEINKNREEVKESKGVNGRKERSGMSIFKEIIDRVPPNEVDEFMGKLFNELWSEFKENIRVDKIGDGAADIAGNAINNYASRRYRGKEENHGNDNDFKEAK